MIEIYPLKAQYRKKENITLRINSDVEITKAEIVIFYLDKEIKKIVVSKAFKTKDIKFNTQDYKAGGYGVEAIVETKQSSNYIHTAFDISNGINDSLRYGFVSDFSEKDKNNGSIDWLRKCHINIVQFYDWSFRHDQLTSNEKEYVDMMGKHINRSTVINKIKEASKCGMRSMAYGAVYASSKDYYQSHKDLAFYYPNNRPITFINTFYLMNIEKKSPWRKHLIDQYYSAIKKMGFNGIHMDTYGFPKTAISHLNKEHIVYLDDEFKSLIDETKTSLKNKKVDPLLIFNNVGNWPLYATANSKTDAVYIEVWNPYDTYNHIVSIIKEANNYLRKSKPIILAAYLKPFRNENIERGLNAAKLLMAAIVSNGAYHLLIGENKAVLTQGYYSDYTLLDDNSANDIKSYYDFMIRYYDFFYDKSLINVSLTHFDGDNIEYLSKSKRISTNAIANSIWLTIRENKKHKILYLVNLRGNKDVVWNNGKEKPKEITKIKFKVKIDKEIKGIYLASPDDNNQHMSELKYDIEDTEKGRYIKFIIPNLKYWDIVDIRL